MQKCKNKDTLSVIIIYTLLDKRTVYKKSSDYFVMELRAHIIQIILQIKVLHLIYITAFNIMYIMYFYYLLYTISLQTL